jgi:hypothetical protein
MRISLSMRAGRVCAAATLVFSLGLAPSFAHTGTPLARPALGPGHFPGFAARGFNSFGFTRFGVNRFGPSRFDRFGLNRFNRFGFSRFGWNANGWGWNQLGVTGWGWGYWGDPNSAPSGPSEPTIIGGGGPPVVVNVVAGSGTGDGYMGGCVIHKLMYDGDGKYVGERQIPQC